MQFPIAAIVLAAATQQLAAANPLVAPAGPISDLEARGPVCQARGAVNGQCGEIFSGGGCNNKIGQIGPDCSGTCYRGSFLSIRASGDGTYGTNCHIYSDDNCQNDIGSTGNIKFSWQGGCKDATGAQGKSYRCYFKC
ncbi:hypothetical protein Micbo1qcDRAFT_202756 [Microdochium bolleyi]|uniref:Uncharacterized protein n=1 Tax=Microdochium bolleyi TaxID=196109 RepID=A0A136J5R5_9PEZI|nr:hypothetical protein Micbo1qcDRAFT_202756 [Microdochium bolleyi]